MLIKSLMMNDYRVYAGSNTFDLAPRIRHGKMRPIVLFGGLNGAGKTSLLSGVRLVLYGKASLGDSVSQKRYEQYLLESIHRPRGRAIAPKSASIEIIFSYAKLGEESEFRVLRSWERAGSSVKEFLEIWENGVEVKGLNYEQAQGFLNELIPIGVSELFFFDGEKIAKLADETGGSTLEYSIKKLLGLDVVERLSGDLTVLNRNVARLSLTSDVTGQIKGMESKLDILRSGAAALKKRIDALIEERSELMIDISSMEKVVADRGGHFSTSRKELEQRLSSLNDEKQQLERQIVELLADSAPLSLCPDFSQRVLSQVDADLEAQSGAAAIQILKVQSNAIKKRLKKSLTPDSYSLLESEFTNAISKLTSAQDSPIHDLTYTQASSIRASLTNADSQSHLMTDLFGRISAIEDELDDLGVSLSRAPDDALVRSDFESLQALQRKLGGLDNAIETLREEGRILALEAVDVARKLDKLYAEASKSSDQGRVLGYIDRTSAFVEDFVTVTAKKKVADLEEQFSHCFARLARKDDLHLRVRIDPETFHVSLLDDDGRVLGKDELSAGERQIFAISILEALAKTAGRHLPMIIDTPLGRLDSKHRSKLIANYFPVASHQMIILSTDTEVDEDFYAELSPNVARAYQLDYNPKTGSTSATEGYFWQARRAG